MAPPATKARLNFLAASAHLYSSTAPATSAHLMLECKRVAANSEIQMKQTGSKPACDACGTDLISGWTSRTFIASPRRSKKTKPKSKKAVQTTQRAGSKLVISKCLVCRRSTKTQLMTTTRLTATRPAVGGAKVSGSVPLPSTASLPTEPNPKTADLDRQELHNLPLPSANLNSKKRAKARKQGGLQAMLEKSKTIETHSSGFGLELTDLLKKA